MNMRVLRKDYIPYMGIISVGAYFFIKRKTIILPVVLYGCET
jgi:hypothetical protein